MIGINLARKVLSCGRATYFLRQVCNLEWTNSVNKIDENCNGYELEEKLYQYIEMAASISSNKLLDVIFKD